MTDAVRFDRNARYGAALVGTLFAAYLNVATDFTAYIQGAAYRGSLGSDVPLVNMVQFGLIVVLSVASFAIVPGHPGRRLGAVTLAVVVLMLWATFGIERGIGTIREPVGFWFVALDQGLITLVVALGGWLLVRGRHPLAFVVLAVAAIPPVAARLMTDASVPGGAYTLVIQGIVVTGGVGGAWAAWAIDRAVRRKGAAAG